MTTVNLIQDFVDPFDYNDYIYSFDYSSNIQTEDEINNIEVVDVENNTITLRFRSEDWYNYVSSSYIDKGWYTIQPMSNDLFSKLFIGTTFVRSDIYYFTSPTGVTLIAYNQPSADVVNYNGLWINGHLSQYGIKMLRSTIIKV